MLNLGYLAALAAASCWALSSLLTVEPVRKLGALPFNAFRMLIVAVMLTVFLWSTGNHALPAYGNMNLLLLSGFIGIFLGDTFLFSAVRRLGPRMAGLLFACNAPISFVLGIWLLGERHHWSNFAGVGLVITGVMIAVSFRQGAGNHQWEQTVGIAIWGLAAGLLAALCQSLGTLIAVNAMTSGTDPVLATTIRVWIATFGLWTTLLIIHRQKIFTTFSLMTAADSSRIIASGLLGMGLGMSLLLWAITVAPMGIVAILSATTPIVILPFLWLFTRERPRTASIVAAFIVVIGVALVFLNPTSDHV